MIVDIDTKHYYYKYINEAKTDVSKYNESLDIVRDGKAKLKEWLKSHKDFLKDKTGINLDEFQEYSIGLYTDGEELSNKALHKLQYFPDSSEERISILQVLRYAKLVLKEHKLNILIKQADKRANITFTQYTNYLRMFYNYGISKCLLEGFAYHFGYGLGDLIISRWKYVNPVSGGKIIDYIGTRRAKKKLLEEGKKPFKLAEARAYAEAGVKYDGVEYTQYKNVNHFYETHIYNSKVVPHRNLKVTYSFNMQVAKKRGSYTFEELAAECKSINDIYNMKCSIKQKLSIALIYDPTISINFVRNPNQDKYERGVHVTKNRRRY